MSTTQTYQLSDLMSDLQMVIKSSFDQTYWVVAELANVSGSPRGHMYFELVEKSEQQIVAKARANLWSYRRHQIIHAFEEVTRQTLKAGMKVLLQLQVDFHPVYGLSFQIMDIDPAYSLGELEKQRQETIQQLKDEGLLEFNKQYVLPSVLQNLAIISSQSAAGYQDFVNQLDSNTYHYKFQIKLFQALMQGDKAPESIANALDKLEAENINYDAIILIRGGGSNLDLACFDDYALNARLAQAYFPIFSGIGHERDTSVTDMIAHTRLKTPTAVAAFIIQHNRQFEDEISDIFSDIIAFTKDKLQVEIDQIESLSRDISQLSQQLVLNDKSYLKELGYVLNNQSLKMINKQDAMIHQKNNNIRFLSKEIYYKTKSEIRSQKKLLQDKVLQLIDLQKDRLRVEKEIKRSTQKFLIQTNEQLNYMEQLIQLSDPQSILKKGFSISRINGKAISNSRDIQPNEILETQLYQGIIKSKILKEKK
jgi:exodeoxyribonuclease VII large subunit